MKKNKLYSILFILLSSLTWAQTTETFESYTSGRPTSFTSNSQSFTITTANCALNAGGSIGIFIPAQNYLDCGGLPHTSTGTGYGVGAGCASSACAGSSDKFIDNGAATGVNQTYSIKTTNNAIFTIKSIYVYISTNQGASSSTTAGVTFRGKKAGVTLFTLNPALTANSNGFTFIDFVAAGYGNYNIDQIEIQGGTSVNYVALDNFRWDGPAAAMTAVATFTAASCNGLSNGRAAVAVSGGAGGYTYSWAPSGGTNALATGLASGTYTCTITDAASTQITSTVTVTQPTAITVTPSFTNTTCNGISNGKASVSASGGTPSYFYSWAPSGGTASLASGLSSGTYTCTITDNNSCTKTQTVFVSQPTAITTSTSVTNVSCNGGSNGVATVLASGGTPGYTYLWAPGGGATPSITGRAAGNYTVTVTDANSCTKMAFANITEPTAISTSTSMTGVACNGGSNGVASVLASGGAGGYTYSWTPSGGTNASATGLAAGNYTVTVTDANSCTKMAFVNVTQPTAISTSTSVTNVACNGGANGSATVAASGGTGSYTYSWTPSGGTNASATGLAAGNYTVTVTDANSCTQKAFVNVTQPTAISTSTSVTNVACNGGSNGVATVVASGGAGGYTYSWAPSGGTNASATGLAAGNYTVTITDANSCPKIAFVNVTQPTAIITSTSVTGVTCNGGANGSATVAASGGTGSYTYSWTPSGGTNSNATGLAAGNYTVTITDANSCTKMAFVNVTQPTAIITSTSVTGVACNGGANGSATVTASGGTGSYTYSWTPSGGTNSNATGLTSGNYTVTVTDANSCTKMAFVTVTQPTPLTATSTQTNVLCFGSNTGKATVNASGGTSPYTYLWAPVGGTGATASGLTQGNYSCTITDNNSCSTTKTVSITQPAIAISATTNFTNNSCFGGSNGSAGVAATGGTSPYTYSWAPSGGTNATATGLSQGTYTCTITDNNSCILTKTVTVSQPASAVSATSSFTNVSCFGGSNGSANVVASGGTSPYTYSWTPSGVTTAVVTGLTQGSYSCTIKDNNGCISTQSVSITQPAIIAATISSTNTACVGNTGMAKVSSVSGGTGTYTYSWSPAGGTGATTTPLGIGVYTCTIKDVNNCSLMLTTSITTINGPTVSIASQTNIACSGGSNGAVQLSVTGGTTPYTYSWTPAVSTTTIAIGLTAGTYSCVVSDNNGCTAFRSINITTPLPLALSSVISSSVLCHGSIATVSVSATGGTAPYTGTGTFTTTAGSKTYTVTDNNSCTSTTSISVIEPAVLNSTASAANILCHNGITTVTVSASGGTAPYTGVGTFTATSGNYSYTITDSHACPISTATISLTNPAPIMVSQSFSLCTGQSVTVGTSTYSTAGTYTNIVISQHGCDSTITTSILVNSLPSLTVTPTTATVCAGSTVSLTASGAATYTWSNGGTGSILAVNPGSDMTYTVSGTSTEGCISSNAPTAFITVNALPNVMASTDHSLICTGETATLSVTGALSYTWSTNSNATDIAVSPTVATTYTVSGTDVNGCSNTTTVTQDVSLCTGIHELNSGLSSITLYPNPSSGLFYMTSSTNAQVVIINAVGQEIIKQSITGGTHLLDLQNQADGLYFVKVMMGNQQKIIKINKQ